jgi:hypothetical protein
MKDDVERRPFTAEDIANRARIIQMLKYEDSLFLGPEGKRLFGDNTFDHITDLETYYTFHRATLAAFGFSATDADVSKYREIFRNYYNGPHDYDAEVLRSVCYMRENKCVYYDAPLINVGDTLPDSELLTLSGESTTLHGQLASLPRSVKHVFVGAFSNS